MDIETMQRWIIGLEVRLNILLGEEPSHSFGVSRVTEYDYPWSRWVDRERTRICGNDIEPLLPDCLVTKLPGVERGPNKMVEEKRIRISNTSVQRKETRIVLSY